MLISGFFRNGASVVRAAQGQFLAVRFYNGSQGQASLNGGVPAAKHASSRGLHHFSSRIEKSILAQTRNRILGVAGDIDRRCHLPRGDHEQQQNDDAGLTVIHTPQVRSGGKSVAKLVAAVQGSGRTVASE
jgi:hypothetical protein